MVSLDWSKVKPSTSPPLSWAGVLALPEGMVVIAGEAAVPLLVLDGLEAGERRVCNWVAGQRWSRPFTLLEIDRAFRLPRLSFALTEAAVRERRKTGLCIGRCGSANREPPAAISQSEVDREGFPGTTPQGFIAVFRTKAPTKRDWDGWVWRLPFTYMEIPA